MPFSSAGRGQETSKGTFRRLSPERKKVGSSTGAFPRLTDSPVNDKAHIFMDDQFEADFGMEDVVEEDSKGSTAIDELMAVSTASSDTPAANNRRGAVDISQSSMKASDDKVDSERSPMRYPFNIQDSVTRLDEEKRRDKLKEQFRASASSRSQQETSYSGSSATSGGDERKEEDVGLKDPMPSPLTPATPFGEDGSVMSGYQSQTNNHNGDRADNQGPNAAQSVMSARSRGQRSKKYFVRHTLCTSQQVNADPASMLKNLFVGIEEERHMHRLAAQNFHAIHNWLLFLPCVGLGLLSGIVVLVFEADINVSDDARVYAAISVGIGSLVSVLLQAVSKMLNLGVRGTLHDVTAAALKRLSEDILLTLSSTESIPAEYVAMVSEKLGQALDTCSSPLPYKVEAAFAAVSDRMELMLKPPTGQPTRKYMHKLDFMRLYTTVYDELDSEIIHWWAWPLLFPRPRTTSEAALRNFKAIVTEGREALPKNRGITSCCAWSREKNVERSLFDIVPPASVAEASNDTYASRYQGYSFPIRNSMLGHEV